MSLSNLRILSAQLQVHYDEMASLFSHFQQSSGLHCISGCGACCQQPTIEASPFEMLPIAFALYDQGMADETLEQLQVHQTPSCFFYHSHSADGSKGQCQIYAQRPTLCRVFGIGSLLDKNAAVKLSVCRFIKQAHPELLNALDPRLAPRIDHWKQKARLLSDELSSQDMPINQALKMALEKLTMLAYYESLQENQEESQQVGYRDRQLEWINNHSTFNS
jgi:uncharacterized protein